MKVCIKSIVDYSVKNDLDKYIQKNYLGTFLLIFYNLNKLLIVIKDLSWFSKTNNFVCIGR